MFVEHFSMILREISHFESMAWGNLSGIGEDFSGEKFAESCFPFSVISDDRDFVSAMDFCRKFADDRMIVIAFRELVYFENNVARLFFLGEPNVRPLDI